MKRLFAILTFLSLTVLLYGQTPWYCGTWKGDDGSKILISKIDKDYVEYEIFYDNPANFYYFNAPEVEDGKLIAYVGDINDYECGELIFSKNNNSIVWDYYSEEKVTYHKDPSIATALREAKIIADTEKRVRMEMTEQIDREHARISAMLIAKNPWVLGTWAQDGYECFTIKADGKAYYPYSDITAAINPYPENGISFEFGESQYTIDWDKRTITVYFDDIPLRKIK